MFKLNPTHTMIKQIGLQILAIFILSSTSSFTQTLGVRAGLNLSNFFVKDDHETYSEDYKWKTGFHVGAIAEFPLSNLVSFETGLLLATKGHREMADASFLSEIIKLKVSTMLYYLEIPIKAKLSIPVGKIKFYGSLGPYIGFGINGKTKSELTLNGQTEKEEEDISWGSNEEDDHLRRLDLGLTMAAGIELKSIQLGLNYNLGLANISAYRDEGATIKNKVIGISLAYRFVK